MRTGIAVVCAVVIAALLGACAEPRVVTLAPAPEDLFDRRQPLRIDASYTVADRHGRVVAGAAEGAGVGMLSGVALTAGAGAQTGDPIGFALGVLLAPVGAVGGAVVGATSARPVEEVRRALDAVEALYADASLLGALEEKVVQQFRSHGLAPAPACAGDVASTSPAGTAIRSVPVSCVSGEANHVRLDVRYGFRTAGAYSPTLVYEIDATMLVATAASARDAQEFRWHYRSPELDFFEMTADRATLLRRRIGIAQERVAARIVDDLLVARRASTIGGIYDPSLPRARFRPDATPSGTVSRVPTDSELENISAAGVAGAPSLPVAVPAAAARSVGAARAAAGGSPRPAASGAPSASGAVTGIGGASAHASGASGPRRIALAPLMDTNRSPSGNCDMNPERDFRVAVESIAGVIAVPARIPTANPQLAELWEHRPVGTIPDLPRVAASPAFADADAVMLIGYQGIGGWYCIRVLYELYLLDRRSGQVSAAKADSSTVRQRMGELMAAWAGS